MQKYSNALWLHVAKSKGSLKRLNRKAFFTSSDQNRYTLWSCKNVTPYPKTWIIFILDSVPSYTDKLLEFRWVQNCAPFVADLSLYCYERDFMDSLNHADQSDVIEAFNSTIIHLIIHFATY